MEDRAPDGNPKTLLGIEKAPLHLVPETAEAHMAMAFADGGYKYQPYNWRSARVSSSVYYAAALRHFKRWWAGADYGHDTPGVHNLGAVMACCAIILDAEATNSLNDDRPPPNPRYAELMEEMVESLKGLQQRDSTKYGLHEISPAPPPSVVTTDDLVSDGCNTSSYGGVVLEGEEFNFDGPVHFDGHLLTSTDGYSLSFKIKDGEVVVTEDEDS